MSFPYFDGIHRFLPALFKGYGYSTKFVEVNHRKRSFGKSKYGVSRIFNVIIDILFIKLFYNEKKRPLYVFGNFSLISFLISLLSMIYMFYLKFFEYKSFIETPLPLLTSISFLIGLVFLSIGTITNLLENISIKYSKEKNYKILKK